MEDKFGKLSEVTNAHIQFIMSLPTIIQTSVEKIQDFYEKLETHCQALGTMGKLKEINGYVRLTLEELQTMQIWFEQITIGKNGTFGNLQRH